MNGKSWTSEEVDVLINMYPLATCEEIIKTLDRSWWSIKNRAILLGIRRDESIRHPKIMPIDRFLKYVNKNSGVYGENNKYLTECWEWIAHRDKNGYGKFRHTTKKHEPMIHAYKFSFEFYISKVPDDKCLDYLCRNPPCVRPDHLEIVTQEVNNLRGFSPPAQNARKSYCIHGHPLFGENLYIQPSTGYRYCRTCKREVYPSSKS